VENRLVTEWHDTSIVKSGVSNSINQITGRIIGCAIEVHKALGPGLLESAYERSMVAALVKAGLRVERQKPVPLTVDGVRIDCAYRLDLLVNEAVVVEVKSVTQRTSLHRAQMLSYLRLTGIKVGLILNFNVKLVALEGIRCVVNGFEDE